MPHTDETFYKLHCGWAEDPKVAELSRFGALDACLARDLFSQLIDYARRELTDGLVPTGQIARVAWPLPAEDALRLAGHLADPGTFGPLCEWVSPRSPDGSADSSAPGTALRILAYAKWNDTRADVQARKQSAVKAARYRWDAPGTAGRNADGSADRYAEQEQEKETPLPPAPRTANRTDAEGWTPHSALTSDPPPRPRKRGGGPRTTHPNVQAVVADANRPGGPATDEQRQARAQEARRLLAQRGQPDQAPADPALEEVGQRMEDRQEEARQLHAALQAEQPTEEIPY